MDAFRIPVDHPRVESVQAFLDSPPGEVTHDTLAILLAHGAGAGPESEFLKHMATGLASRGSPVLRFRYPYAERAAAEGRRLPPDRAPRLEHAHERALAALRERHPGNRILLAGRSMGGRMGSHLAARGEDCAGLIFFGYPLHPAGRPEQERSEHFPAIPQPSLFLQGSRDALCGLDGLRRSLARYGGVAALHVVDEADHGFHVQKRTGRSDEEVREELLEAVAAWIAATFPS